LKKRVLYILRYFPTLTETFVYEEIRGLMARGHSVTIAALGDRADGAANDELPEVPVLHVPRRSLRSLGAASPGRRWLSTVQRAKDAARLPWLARRVGDFDLVHTHFAGEAAEWARALRRDGGPPYTVTVHASDLFKPRPALVPVLQDAGAVLAVADFHIQRLAEMGISATRLRCGPDLSKWTLGPPPVGPLRALFVGRNVPKKGLDALLDAWPAQGTLDVISDYEGPVPPGVRVLGPLPPSGVRAAMMRANVVVLPCRQAPDGDMDGVPLALMEGLAAGRPVITTAVSGIPELIDEHVGWLLPPDDVPALRAALLAAVQPSERARRGSGGPDRLRARQFTLADQISGLIAAWSAMTPS
jgi:colanic acid/amylovoran biosynthesis glycosyltransferase